MSDQLNLNTIRDTVQDCNINLLLGAGTSSPYLKLLGSIEALLTELADPELSLDDDKKKILRASIYKYFYNACLAKNTKLLTGDAGAQENLDSYKDFLKTLNYLLLSRKSTILSKQVNIFTTNVDMFLEKAFEETGLEYNDGFSGRFYPKFSLSNYKKSQFKKSLHYDNTSELPVFNLLKLHGSLTWQIGKDNKTIEFLQTLKTTEKIGKLSIPAGSTVAVDNDSTLKSLIEAVADLTLDPAIDGFLKTYEKLAIVNPNPEKFKHSLLNRTYYELLRMYSNELEKENTVLFVAGFSFADQHIREVTLRAANSNPTLIIYIFAYSRDAEAKLRKLIDFGEVKNSNIKIIAPELAKNNKGKDEEGREYDLANINEAIFDKLISHDESKPKKDIEEKVALET